MAARSTKNRATLLHSLSTSPCSVVSSWSVQERGKEGERVDTEVSSLRAYLEGKGKGRRGGMRRGRVEGRGKRGGGEREERQGERKGEREEGKGEREERKGEGRRTRGRGKG